MIRVLHVLGGLARGGAETMVMNLYRAIDRTQVQFDFIIHTEERQAYYDEIIALGGKIYSFPAFNGKNFFAMRKLWKNFFKEHPEYKILHSHVRSYASLYLPIAKKAGLKTIIHSHNTSNGHGLASFVKRIMQYPIRWQSDYYFTCSKEAGKWLFGNRIVNGSRYFLLPNAIDVNAYAFDERMRTKYRKEFCLENKFVIGHVGRFAKQKNHDFLLDVFKSVYERNSSARLLLVGTGELMDDVKKKCDDMGISECVLFLGSRSDVAQLFSAMDVFVFPSLHEGLPVTVVEAQAAGIRSFISDKITRDVELSNLLTYLSIDSGVESWTNEILSCQIERVDFSMNLKNAGFDIFDSAKKLSTLYFDILKGWNCL